MIEVVGVGAILLGEVGELKIGAKLIVLEVVGVGAIVVGIILAKAMLVGEVRAIVVGVILAKKCS